MSEKETPSNGLTRREALGAPVLGFAALAAPNKERAEDEPPYNAMGERVGEVTDRSAIVHTRLTALATRNDLGYSYPFFSHALPREEREAIGIPDGLTTADLHGACPGAPGRVRLIYGTDPSLANAKRTEWFEVDGKNDFTHKFVLKDLSPDRRYYYATETGALKGSRTRVGATGSFGTAPRAEDWRPVKFSLITCQDYACRDHPLGGFRVYESMARLGADFLVSAGDNVYYDIDVPVARSVEIARHHWHRMYSQPLIVNLLRQMPAYWLKDDHDSFEDDDWATRKAQRVQPMDYETLAPVFLEQVAIGDKIYRTVRWGKGLELWLVENRDFRSPNSDPDGPRKTIWGTEQKQWLKQTLLKSDAQFRVLVSPTAVVGPSFQTEFRYPGGGGDSHGDVGYATEGREFRNWVRENGLDNFFVVIGDRHWQYHSVDPETGVREFCCGAVTDTHSVKHEPDPRYHKFMRCLGGFLSVSLEGTRQQPRLAFRFHDTFGAVMKEFTF